MATQLQIRRGTTTENNVFTGAAGELTMDTDTNGLRIHDGTTVGGVKIPTAQTADYVVEWQAPTDLNGYTWYRKYKSGWVEQGGYIEPKNVTWTETVVLPVPFENLYYNITLGALEPGADKAYVRYVHVTAYDETTITMTGSYMNTTNNIGCFWSACGMAA